MEDLAQAGGRDLYGVMCGKELAAMSEVGVPILAVVKGYNVLLLLVGEGMSGFAPGVAMDKPVFSLER